MRFILPAFKNLSNYLMRILNIINFTCSSDLLNLDMRFGNTATKSNNTFTFEYRQRLDFTNQGVHMEPQTKESLWR
ncbi:hypothetical protein VIBHAR_05921 [Vibrio campbellii ATCC BAA-1116]|uniref:Uncharacterized protein n=1 Tax=Vibrio campbellii (strain ATCC BAA-1116) TaxID=2902295 RepID=A7N5G3_VIBC1|nr:hypothetical protein VIBHAR_05921 [Vibrio campbellii ATCC BAA-1116]